MATIDGPLDANGNLEVNLPLVAAQAGFGQTAFVKSPGVARVARVNAEGELRMAQNTRLFDSDFNGPAAGALLNNQWNQQATTMASVISAGFLRLNSGVVTTINTGISINTYLTFPTHDMSTLKLSAILRHTNGAISNKQMDLGFGYYDVAAQQNAVMNEFVGFRWTQAGNFVGVVEYSAGGAPTTITVNLNGGVPFSDNVARAYEIFPDETGVDFYVDGVWLGNIPIQADAPGILKASGYPVIARLFNAASAPTLAPVFEIGSVVVGRIGPGQNEDRATLQVAQGRHATRAQAGVQSANGSTNSVPASGTAPTVLVPSNTVSGLVGLGGYGRTTMTGVVAATHTELIMASFQNPTVPEALGAGNNGRSLILTDLMISPMIVSVLFAGGGFTAEWFLAYGSTALSLATTDAVGGASIGTKSPTKIPLPIFDTLAAAAAVGTIAIRTGEQGLINLQTPIVINPGEFVHVGLRTMFVAAAVTAGAVDYGIGFSGYWQ